MSVQVAPPPAFVHSAQRYEGVPSARRMSIPRLDLTGSNITAAFWNASTQSYHLFHQSSNNSWGHSTSTDLLNWNHSQASCLALGSCIRPTGPHGEKDQLTAIFPTRNNVSVAVSTDDGKSWHTTRPISLSGTPRNIVSNNVYLGRYPSLSHMLHVPDSTLHGLTTSGTAAHLYTVSKNGLAEWTYKNPLISFPQFYQPSRKWTKNFGNSWKKAEFMTLACPKDPSYTRDFFLFTTDNKDSLWLSGTLTREADDGVVDLDYDFSGVLDHGSAFHSTTSFTDPRSRRVVLGGVGATMALPRLLSIIFIPGVISALKTPLEDLECFGLEDERDGMTGVRTLGVQPLPELPKTGEEELPIFDVVLGGKKATEPTEISSNHFELEANIDVRKGCKKVGLHILHSKDMSSRTTIWFSPEDEELGVTQDGTLEEKGSHTLFLLKRAGEEIQELLQLRVFIEGGEIELFANERFALSTVVPEVEGMEITAFAEGSDECAVFESVKIWAADNE